MIALFLALAGGAGAGTRFVVDGLVRSRARTALPLGTIVINVTGSLLLGFLTGMVAGRYLAPDVGLIFGTGFLGGYTTFSTASFETVRLIQARRTGLAVANALGTMILCLLAAAAGTVIAALL